MFLETSTGKGIDPMAATALIISEFEADGRHYQRRLREVGFDPVVTGVDDALRVYLDSRPELVVLDLLSEDQVCSLVGSISVGGWRNVTVPMVVVGEDADRYLAAGAHTVMRRSEVEDTLSIAASALYAERCRKLLERARADRGGEQYLEVV